VFDSLDYIYVPAADVDGETARYVEVLGAELVWKVRGQLRQIPGNALGTAIKRSAIPAGQFQA
jgi:hypothetical protein